MWQSGTVQKETWRDKKWSISLDHSKPPARAFFLGALTGGGNTSWLFSVKVHEEIENYQCQPTNQPVADKS